MAILPSQEIEKLLSIGAIVGGRGDFEDRLQPASLDLRLGRKAYRVRASFLPGKGLTVSRKLDRFSLHEIDLTEGAVLETGGVYVVPLLEGFALPDGVSALVNPKSSTGRVDVFTRAIADGIDAFDRIPEGYHGPLYVEISPRTFPILVRQGSRLSQVRFHRGSERCSSDELDFLHSREPLISNLLPCIEGKVGLTVDLSGEGCGGLVGFCARKHTAVLDLDRSDTYDVPDFWEPIYRRETVDLILDPDRFYILSSKESIVVPPILAAEMAPFDPLIGEFRVHYAGFFDPGFGYGETGEGSRAVLEVRSYSVPFILEHGQIVGHLTYRRLTDCPEKLYGQGICSHYQGQGLKLSKHFKDFFI